MSREIGEERKVRMTNFVKIALSVTFVLLLVSSMSSVSFQANQNALKLPDKWWVDGTHNMPWREKKPAPTPINLAAHSGGGGGYPDFVSMVGDWYTNLDYAQNFHWVLTGTHCYIYVAWDAENYYDAATDEYVFENPNYPIGGWSPEDRISTAQLTYLMNEFDSNIYPTMTSTFGFPVERPAGETKIYILIMNIRDPSYYDSSINWYVVGYFSPSEDSALDQNMVHIDSFDWANRVGPGVSRPFTYEGTFAHEFEHLIHNDIDFDEESWVDEGLADMAIYMCGYGHDTGNIAYYFLNHPWTSLTFWGGNLENYGCCYLFQLYLWEHFGGTPFTVALVHNPLNGIEGIEDTLNDFEYSVSFDEVFHDWTIANYIDDLSIGDGKYGYYTLDIPSADTWGYSIQYFLWNALVGTEFNRGFGWQASEWPGTVQPYTANYWEFGFTPAGQEVNFLYGGDTYAGFPPHTGTYHWYGGVGNWVWRQLHQIFSIPAGGATLKFWTRYTIELDWDYGYVEVHDLTDNTWTTLPGIKTTDTLPQRQDNPTTPASREPTAYDDAGTWNALTGDSGGYYEEVMDLAPFAGDNIELYFVYWTDGAYNEVGFFVDDISIPEIAFNDPVDGAGTWTNEDWTLTTGTDFPNYWQGLVFDVTGIEPYRVPSCRYNMRTGKMINFQPGMLCNVWDFTDGSLTIPNNYVNTGHKFVAVFWNAAPHILRGDYWFYAY
jgi:hypothetical protein